MYVCMYIYIYQCPDAMVVYFLFSLHFLIRIYNIKCAKLGSQFSGE